MTRDEIRQLAEHVNATRRAWMEPITRQPAYWDNFPHLRYDAAWSRDAWEAWEGLLYGLATPERCDACGQMVWEYDWFIEGYRADFVIGHLRLCLPCLKAADVPDVWLRRPYEAQFDWDMDDILPSEGVLTLEWFQQKEQEERAKFHREKGV